jgi:hypothetical protein
MMKQKTGLGKKVSSIFDGVPLPNIMRETPQAPARHDMPTMPSYRQDTVPQPRPMQTVPPQPPKPMPAAMPQPPKITPPKNIGSSASATAVSENSFQQLIYKMFLSGSGENDARNKKAVAMVGMLSVVLVVVLMWTGVFSGSPKGAVRASSTVAAATASNEARIDWTPPEPYPANLRDPMVVGSSGTAGSGSSGAATNGMLVKSIVYVPNDTKSSTALINGEICREGKSIGGATIMKINKDSVEFSADGKSWKQQVE